MYDIYQKSLNMNYFFCICSCEFDNLIGCLQYVQCQSQCLQSSFLAVVCQVKQTSVFLTKIDSFVTANHNLIFFRESPYLVQAKDTKSY